MFGENILNESFNNFFLNLIDKQMINQVIKRYVILLITKAL